METKERVDSNPPRLLRSVHFSFSISTICLSHCLACARLPYHWPTLMEGKDRWEQNSFSSSLSLSYLSHLSSLSVYIVCLRSTTLLWFNDIFYLAQPLSKKSMTLCCQNFNVLPIFQLRTKIANYHSHSKYYKTLIPIANYKSFCW